MKSEKNQVLLHIILNTFYLSCNCKDAKLSLFANSYSLMMIFLTVVLYAIHTLSFCALYEKLYSLFQTKMDI